MRSCIIWLNFKRLVQKRYRYRRVFSEMAVRKWSRAQDEVVCLQAVRAAPPRTIDLRVTQIRFDSPDNLVRYVVLQSENIVDLSIIAFGPDMRAVFRVNQLRVDPHP